ncbi:hypothetical protein GGR36_001423 [Niveibacterium umoris]|uniref:Uncharacterized protein n=1 Tax=Niveibacterium umoris TaxID=1193620 RepID=A0A840BG10_9RHOO|nr:hypothetical protein [Niveibacterium umoris]
MNCSRAIVLRKPLPKTAGLRATIITIITTTGIKTIPA